MSNASDFLKIKLKAWDVLYGIKKKPRLDYVIETESWNVVIFLCL